MKVPGFNDIFYYRHPLGVNCVVYAFKRGDGALDLIDTGIYYVRPVLADVVRRMAKDGLDFHRVKNIFHTHGHFDHCQADKWFIGQSTFEDVKVHCPTRDAWRLQQGNDARQLGYFLEHMKKYLQFNTSEMLSKGGFGSIAWQFRFFLSKFMKIPPLDPACIVPLHDGASIRIGAHKGSIITTGGHSDGHSFFHFPSIDTLVIGDHDAVNELTCDYRKIIKATAIIRELDPSVCLIGHQGVPAMKVACRAKTTRWFSQLRHVVGMFVQAAERFDNKLPASYFLEKLLGYMKSINWLRYWAFQGLFVIAKFLVDEGLGTINYDEEKNDLVLDVKQDALRGFAENIDARIDKIRSL